MFLEAMIVIMLGLVVGSFLNVCIYRIPRRESIVNPPSHCPNCKYKLGIFDLIPVFSYLFLGGKCRKCKEKISIRYPAIETLTAVVFFMIYYNYSFSFEFFAYSIFMAILIAVFFIDIEHLIIPNRLVAAGMVIAIITMIYNACYPMNIYGDSSWWSPILGILVGSGTLLLVSILGMLVYKCNEVMGMGDVKIFAPIGIMLGWRMTMVALMLSIFTGAIVSVILICVGLKNRKSTIAFGPFIVISTFITILWGWRLLQWWLNLY